MSLFRFRLWCFRRWLRPDDFIFGCPVFGSSLYWKPRFLLLVTKRQFVQNLTRKVPENYKRRSTLPSWATDNAYSSFWSLKFAIFIPFGEQNSDCLSSSKNLIFHRFSHIFVVRGRSLKSPANHLDTLSLLWSKISWIYTMENAQIEQTRLVFHSLGFLRVYFRFTPSLLRLVHLPSGLSWPEDFSFPRLALGF